MKMGKLRNAVESFFIYLATLIIRFRWLVIIASLAIVVLLASNLRFMTYDMSTEAFLHEEDPSIKEYNAFREQFGRDEMIVLMVSPENVFELEFLEKLREFHYELEDNVPYLDEITSLVNARLTRGTEGALIVEDLLEDFPETEEDIERLKKRVLNNPMYRNLLVSEDGTLTTIVIRSQAYSPGNDGTSEVEFDSLDSGFEFQDTGFDSSETGFDSPSTGFGSPDINSEAPEKGNDSSVSGERIPLTNAENSEMVSVIRELMKEYNSDDFPVYISGSPVITDYLKRAMQKDMMRFTTIAILTIATLLFLLFRRLSGVALPLLTVLLSVISTFSLMALTGTPLKLPHVILPSFLLAIGIGASVHLMAIFYKFYKEGDKTSAIKTALGHSGLPITMTGLTTSVGLASFARAKLAPIAELGQFASIGVLISLLFTLLLVPALIYVIPVKPVEGADKEGKRNTMDRVLQRCGDFAVDNRLVVVVFAILLAAFSIAGIFRLEVTHHVLQWFPEDSEIRQNTELIDEKMKGTLAVEVVIDTREENGLYEPAILKKIEHLGDRLMNYESEQKNMFVGKTLSLADMLKEINQALNENKEEYYRIPDDQRLIAQEFLLFENSGADDLEDMVDSLFSITHLTAKVPWNDSVAYIDFNNYLVNAVDETFGDEVDITITGIIKIMMDTIIAMMQSTIESYAVAVIVITILMILLIGNIKMGFLSMIPNLTPIIITLGLMGWLNIKLDMFSMLIGSIAIGLAVDDTIHFFHNFRRYYDKTGDVKRAVENTLTTAGRAMLVTTLVLATGFWIFMAATMQNLFYFGLLTGITLVFAFLADLIIAPALLAIVTRDKE